MRQNLGFTSPVGVIAQISLLQLQYPIQKMLDAYVSIQVPIHPGILARTQVPIHLRTQPGPGFHPGILARTQVSILLRYPASTQVPIHPRILVRTQVSIHLRYDTAVREGVGNSSFSPCVYLRDCFFYQDETGSKKLFYCQNKMHSAFIVEFERSCCSFLRSLFEHNLNKRRKTMR